MATAVSLPSGQLLPSLADPGPPLPGSRVLKAPGKVKAGPREQGEVLTPKLARGA